MTDMYRRLAAAAPSLHVAVVLLTGWMAATPVSAQAPAGVQRRSASVGRVPRTSDGRPDLQGVWSFAWATPLERTDQFANKPVLTDAEAARFLKGLPAGGCRFIKCDGSAQNRLESAYDDSWYDPGSTLADNRTSLIVDPPDGRVPPMTPEARQQVAEARAQDRGRALIDGPEQATLVDRCLVGFNSGPPMNPSAYNNMVQITQTSRYVVIYNEMVHNSRIVPLDGRPLPPSDMRLLTGVSRGRWEGDTLVVETSHFRRDSVVGPSGHSSIDPDHFRLVERFSRTAAGLQYEYTMHDPRTWTKPWTVRVPMRASDEPIYEYACHEGNHSMPNRLAAARAADGRTPSK